MSINREEPAPAPDWANDAILLVTIARETPPLLIASIREDRKVFEKQEDVRATTKAVGSIPVTCTPLLDSCTDNSTALDCVTLAVF